MIQERPTIHAQFKQGNNIESLTTKTVNLLFTLKESNK